LLPGVVSAGTGKTITVDCANNQTTDRPAIQSAIDSADGGDTVKLAGTCQLDGTQVFITKSNLTITGAGAPGSWSTVVKGIAVVGGTPQGDGSTAPFPYFNRGFHIGDETGNSQVENVLIENIKFSTLHRGVIVGPQIGGNTGLCSGITVGTGSASSIVVQNNWFDNDDRAAEIFGTANKVTLQNNRVTNNSTGDTDFIVIGQSLGCTNPLGVNGQGSLSPFGIPENSAIVGNSISGGHEAEPIEVAYSDKITVAANSISTAGGTYEMILLIEDSNSLVSINQITAGGSAAGIFASDDGSAVPGFPPNSSNDQISYNFIRNGTPGIAIDSDTTGYSIILNGFQNDTVADIYLCGTAANLVCDGATLPSFNNTVVYINPHTTVINDGTGNKIL